MDPIAFLQKCKLVKKGCIVPPRMQEPLIRLVERIQMSIAMRPPDFKFSLQDFEFGGKLGSGHFGTVFLVRERSTEVILAIKVIEKELLIRENALDDLCREIEIQSKLQHINIVKYFTYFVDPVNVYLIMEYLSGGTLCEILNSLPNHKLEQTTAAKYVYQMADALNYLHSFSIVHFDVKPENILLDFNGDVKLGDFTLAARCSCLRHFNLSSVYTAPEIISKKSYDCNVDIWSLGVLMYELLCGQTPFSCKNTKNILRKIEKGQVNFPKHLSTDAVDLISKILKYIPDERICLPKVMEHQWISEHYLCT